jgi:hypothetical protein
LLYCPTQQNSNALDPAGYIVLAGFFYNFGWRAYSISPLFWILEIGLYVERDDSRDKLLYDIMRGKVLFRELLQQSESTIENWWKGVSMERYLYLLVIIFVYPVKYYYNQFNYGSSADPLYAIGH